MKEKLLKKYSSIYPKSRSLIAGNINAKKPNINIIKDIDFVVYEVMDRMILNQFQKIKKLGLLLPQYILKKIYL